MPDYSPSWAGSVPDVKPDADGAEPILDDEILDHVAESQELLPREKETTVRFGKHDDRAIVHTDEAGLARRLLAHPRAALRFASVEQHADARTVETVAALRGLDDGARVTAVDASVPVGVLKIRRAPRSTDHHAPVITEEVFPWAQRADR